MYNITRTKPHYWIWKCVRRHYVETSLYDCTYLCSGVFMSSGARVFHREPPAALLPYCSSASIRPDTATGKALRYWFCVVPLRSYTVQCLRNAYILNTISSAPVLSRHWLQGCIPPPSPVHDTQATAMAHSRVTQRMTRLVVVQSSSLKCI